MSDSIVQAISKIGDASGHVLPYPMHLYLIRKKLETGDVISHIVISSSGLLIVIHVASDDSDSIHNRAWWSPEGRFVNKGVREWHRARESWNKDAGTVSHSSVSPAVDFSHIVEGLSASNRELDLPCPIPLSDMVDILNDVWEAEEDW